MKYIVSHWVTLAYSYGHHPDAWLVTTTHTLLSDLVDDYDTDPTQPYNPLRQLCQRMLMQNHPVFTCLRGGMMWSSFWMSRPPQSVNTDTLDQADHASRHHRRRQFIEVASSSIGNEAARPYPHVLNSRPFHESFLIQQAYGHNATQMAGGLHAMSHPKGKPFTTTTQDEKYTDITNERLAASVAPTRRRLGLHSFLDDHKV